MLLMFVSLLLGCGFFYYIVKNQHDFKKVLIVSIACFALFSYVLSESSSLIKNISHKNFIIKKNKESMEKVCLDQSGEIGAHYDFSLDDLLITCKFSFQSKKLYYDITTESFDENLDLVRSNYKKL